VITHLKRGLTFTYKQALKKSKNRRFIPYAIAAAFGLMLSLMSPAMGQEDSSEVVPSLPSAATQPSPSAPQSDVYFADIEVRGRPLFQVGGLTDLSATARSAVINRRIASILATTDSPGRVQVESSDDQGWATLRVNNRVVMTVTQQDADDFGVSVVTLAAKWADELNEAFDKPSLFIDVAQRLNGTLRQLSRNSVDKFPAIVGALVVALLTWAIAAIVRYAAFTWAQQTEGDRSTEVLIGRLGYGLVWVFGTIIALGVLGLEFGALLSAFGLTSVAIGFSLKDVLSNYISGVVLLAARPFRLGDQVVIDNFEGTITQIQLRATTMQTYDGRTVYIPNQEVFQASITNNTASPYRRSSVIVGVDYDADLSEAKTVICQAISNIAGISKDSPMDVLVQELAASTVNLEVRFWVDSRRHSFLETTSNVAQAIKEALQTAQVEMPTEIYTLQFRSGQSLDLHPASDYLTVSTDGHQLEDE
jgi:small-conductance mechanosensitive channel